jgi:hypothetical protein
VRAAAALLALWCAVAAAGCRSREGQQLDEAIGSFLDFGLSNEERAKTIHPEDTKRPHLHERSRRVELESKGGPRLEVELDMPHQLSKQQVEDALAIELARLATDEPYPSIRVVGRPAGLVVHGGVMGVATATKGRDGALETKVRAAIRDDRPALTPDQYEALVDLELALARGTAATKARAETAERRGAAVVDEAVKVAKRRFGPR